MRTKTIKISDEVMAILQRSTITDTSLKLPDEQLDRPMYDAVNKIIVAAGGKWSKTHKAHLFPTDPREALGMAMETGEVVNQKQTFQEFFTPESVVEQMLEYVTLGNGVRVLEPSAGVGNIANAAVEHGCRVFCCEIQPKNAAVLRENKHLLVWEGDFLKFPSDMLRKFDVVLMNPPFNDGQDRAHVLHASEFLADGGTLVAVMSGGTPTGSTKSHKQFLEWVESVGGTFEDIEDGAFKQSGTGVKTVMLVVRK